MMKIQALENFTPRWWTPPGQAGDEQVAFKIQPLDGIQYAEVAQNVVQISGSSGFGAEATTVAIKHGLVGWRNFKTPSGVEVVFSPANIRLIPFNVRTAIFAEILDISGLDEAQEKNLESPSTSPEIGSASIA